MLETVTQADLRRRTVEAMEEDLRISDKQAKDFVASLVAVIQDAISEGDKVSLFGIVTLNTGFRLGKPRRKGTDPRTGEETTFNASPAKVTIRAAVGKGIKDALPSPATSAGKALKARSEERKAAAEKRAKQRERELAGAGKKGRK